MTLPSARKPPPLPFFSRVTPFFLRFFEHTGQRRGPVPPSTWSLFARTAPQLSAPPSSVLFRVKDSRIPRTGPYRCSQDLRRFVSPFLNLFRGPPELSKNLKIFVRTWPRAPPYTLTHAAPLFPRPFPSPSNRHEGSLQLVLRTSPFMIFLALLTIKRPFFFLLERAFLMHPKVRYLPTLSESNFFPAPLDNRLLFSSSFALSYLGIPPFQCE